MNILRRVSAFGITLIMVFGIFSTINVDTVLAQDGVRANWTVIRQEIENVTDWESNLAGIPSWTCSRGSATIMYDNGTWLLWTPNTGQGLTELNAAEVSTVANILSELLGNGQNQRQVPNIVIDGRQVNLTLPPRFVNGGDVIVPIHSIAEPLGLTVTHNATNNTILMVHGNIHLEHVIGSQTISENGIPITVNGEIEWFVPSKIIDGSAFVSLHMLLMTVVAQADWNSATNTFTVESLSPTTYANNNIHIIINGRQVILTPAPRFVDNDVMVPILATAEPLGMTVTLDSNKNTILMVHGNTNLEHVIGSQTISENGVPITVNGEIEWFATSRIIDGTTFVSMHMLLMTVVTQADWDGSTNTFNIVQQQQPTQPTTPTTPTDPSEISVFLDGRRLTFEIAPQTINGRTMLPLRAIFEEMGATVAWDGATQTATAIRGDTVVVLTVGSLSPTVNGVVVPIDQAGVIIDGRTLAPLRFVAEAYGGTVAWDGATRTATITKN